MTTKKLTIRQKLLVAGTLFGMFFGAGNLIFPVHLGQMAGRNAIPAMIGFIITAVGIPVFGVAAIGITHSDGGYAEDGDAHRGDDKADGGGYCIAAGHLAQVNGEDQVSGAEEHAKQRSGHKNSLLDRQSFGHGKINSFMLKSYTIRLQK